MPVKAKITLSSIKALEPADKRLNDTEVTGFHARISSVGAISYFLFYRHEGKQVNYHLGYDGRITPAQARDLAKNKIAEVTQGTNVHEVKKQDRIKTKQSKLSTLQHFLDEKYFPWLLSRTPKTADKTKKHFNQLLANLWIIRLRILQRGKLRNSETNALIAE